MTSCTTIEPAFLDVGGAISCWWLDPVDQFLILDPDLQAYRYIRWSCQGRGKYCISIEAARHGSESVLGRPMPHSEFRQRRYLRHALGSRS